MNKEQIEKLAREIYDNSIYSMPLSSDIARYIVENGYRKVPENAVVLTEDEWETVEFNFDQVESQGRRINDFNGQLLLENAILKEKLEQAYKEIAENNKIISDYRQKLRR